MTEPKTQKTEKSVQAFLNTIEDERKREDSQLLIDLLRQVTGDEPAMWGESIVGFGEYHYRYASGREGNWPLTAFSPRKQNFTIYLNYGFEEDVELMSRLGKYKTGKACLYIKSLKDINTDILRKIVSRSIEKTKSLYASKK